MCPRQPAGEPLAPTPYADVNEVLHDLAARTRAILGDQFVGMYLYGSLALGDFDPQGSDIDYLVVTGSEIPDERFLALQDMHARFGASDSPWAGRVEAAYIPRAAVRRSAPAAGQYPQIEKGTALARDPLEIGWAFQCHTVREHGVVVAGPDPRTLIDPVDPHDMRRAAEAIAGMWLEQARHDPEWLDWVRRRDAQAFVVLTLCRLLYSLGTGGVPSKPAAARWAQEALGPRWAALIERSLPGQHDEGEAPAGDVAATIRLIEYTVERANR